MQSGAPYIAQFKSRSVLLIGGGRWGRVHADNLRRLLPAEACILWVSQNSRIGLAHHVAESNVGSPTITLLGNLSDALTRRPDAAIVVTAPHTHGAVARSTLEHGISTFVEKPLTMDEREAASLIELANRRGLVFGGGLHLLMTSYLHHFRSLWATRAVSSGWLTWFDPEVETRYGETKKADIWTPKVHDIFPHLWAILQVLLPEAKVTTCATRRAPRGAVGLTLDVGGAAIEAEFGRRATKRVRRIELQFRDGGRATLDFTREPGIVTLDGKVAEPDPDWGRTLSPLAREISTFLAAVDDPEKAADWPCLARSVLDSVSGAVEVSARLRTSEAILVAQQFKSDNDGEVQPEVRDLLIDNLAPEFAALGLRTADSHAERNIVLAATAALRVLQGAAAARPAEVAPQFFEAALQSNFLRQAIAAGATVRHRHCAGPAGNLGRNHELK